MKRLMTAAMLAALAVGCGQEAEKAPPPAAKPVAKPTEKLVYMNDAGMQTMLKEADVKRKELLATRDRVIAQMQALVKANGGDEAKARATDEGKALAARLADVDTAIRELGEKVIGDWKTRRDALKGAAKK